MENNYSTDQARPFMDCYRVTDSLYTDIPPAFLSSANQISVFLRN